MSAQTNNQHDPYAPSNGVRERYTLVGVIVGVLSVGAALYFIFETVPSATLVLIGMLVGGAVFVTYRVTRTVTRDHDAEVVQAGMAGMTRAIEFMERHYQHQSQSQIQPSSQYQLPPGPPQRPHITANPGNVWVSDGANGLRNVDARELPVQDADTVTLTMQDGGIDTIPVSKLMAFINQYPKITQDGFTAKGGGTTEDYKLFGETLCDCEPPLLLRKPDKRGGYTFAGQHWGAIDGWLRAHNLS